MLDWKWEEWHRKCQKDVRKWVKLCTFWTEEQQEQVVERKVQELTIRKLIMESRRRFREGSVNVLREYLQEINWWTWQVVNQPRRCTNWAESHTHNWWCGSCLECLGTGRTLLLFPSRSRGAKCIACGGSRVRSQEFENSDYSELMKDDLTEHISVLWEFRTHDNREAYRVAKQMCGTDYYLAYWGDEEEVFFEEDFFVK